MKAYAGIVTIITLNLNQLCVFNLSERSKASLRCAKLRCINSVMTYLNVLLEQT